MRWKMLQPGESSLIASNSFKTALMKEGICLENKIPDLSPPITLPQRVKFLSLSDSDNGNMDDKHAAAGEEREQGGREGGK